MSSYYDNSTDPPRRHKHRHREVRETYDDGYADDQFASSRRAPGQYDLIRRPREDSDSYVEEVQRDFPPSGYGYASSGRSSRPSNRRRASSADGYNTYGTAPAAGYIDTRRANGSINDDRSSDRGRRGGREEGRENRKRSQSRGQQLAGAAIGALATAGGYELWERRQDKQKGSRSKSRNRLAQAGLGVAGALAGFEIAKHVAQDQDERHVENGEIAPGGKSRRKSFSDAAMGIISPSHGGQQEGGRGRNSSRSRGGGSSRGSRSRSPEFNAKIQQALKAALTAAAAEGWRSRDEPGNALSGEKLRRIVTAAVSAAGVDALVDKDPEDHKARNTIISALAGLLGNRVINGSRDQDFGTSHGGRSLSRGQSPSNGAGVGALAGLGAAAAAGKALYDRSRSRNRNRDRSLSNDSYGRSASRERPRRSSSVSAFINSGLAKVGLGDKESRGRGRENSRGQTYDNGYDGARGGAVGAGAGAGAGAAANKRSNSSSSDSSMDSETEKKTRRKMRGKEYLTAGFATVATLNAAHELYESVEARNKRHKEVMEGTLSPEEARKKKAKAQMKDAVAVGIAGLGVKGAYDTWRETQETRKECHEFDERRAEHRRKKLERSRSLVGTKRDYIDNTNGYASAPIYDEPGSYGGAPAGPVYQDGNPYGAAGDYPPPPGASNGRPYDNRRY